MADATPRHATRGGKPTLLVSRVILFRPSYLGEKESWSISPGISRRSRQLAPSHFPLSHMILPKMSLFHHSFFVLPSFLPSFRLPLFHCRSWDNGFMALSFYARRKREKKCHQVAAARFLFLSPCTVQNFGFV